jgi:hypothetical protein
MTRSTSTVTQNSEFFSTASSRPAVGRRLRRRLGRRMRAFGPLAGPQLISGSQVSRNIDQA